MTYGKLSGGQEILAVTKSSGHLSACEYSLDPVSRWTTVKHLHPPLLQFSIKNASRVWDVSSFPMHFFVVNLNEITSSKLKDNMFWKGKAGVQALMCCFIRKLKWFCITFTKTGSILGLTETSCTTQLQYDKYKSQYLFLTDTN